MYNKFDLKKKTVLKAQRLPSLCFYLIAAMVFIVSAPVYAQSNDVFNRLNRLENEIDTLNRAVYKGEQPPRPIYNSNDDVSANNNAAQTEIRLQQMETQIRELTGKLEEQLYTINQLRENISRLEQVREAAIPQTNNGSLMPQAQETQAKVPANSLGIDFEAQTPTGMQTATPIRTNNDATAQYESAYLNLKERNYNDARDQFEDFLREHPNHVLSANAKYWLGETYYVEGEFKEAAKIFAQGFQAFPDSAKSPDMLLKLGLSLSNLDKQEEACIALSQLPVKFKSAPGNILDRGANEMDRLNCGS